MFVLKSEKKRKIRILEHWVKVRVSVTHTHTHTHNLFTALLEFVRDHPGEQVPER